MTINFISPPDLAILLEQRPSEVLLIDIRTPGEFQKETIILSVCFNLQACDFVSTSALEAPTDAEYVFPAEALRFFRQRNLYEVVVVNEDGVVDSKLEDFIVELTGEHRSETKKVRLLYGGYKTYRTLYPALCVGSPHQDAHLIERIVNKMTENAPTKVLPYLYCGGANSALDQRALDMLAITHLVNTAQELSTFKPHLKYLYCGVDEFPVGNMIPVFEKIISSIRGDGKTTSEELMYLRKKQQAEEGIQAPLQTNSIESDEEEENLC